MDAPFPKSVIMIATNKYECKYWLEVKASFSFYNIIPKNAQRTTLYTNWSLYITFSMINYI